MTKRILVVESDEAIAGALSDALSRVGLEPVVAPDGDTARAAVIEEAFAAALVAVQRPDIDPRALVGDLRRTPDGAVLPILLVGSGAGDPALQNPTQALAVGADYYFHVPDDLPQIGDRVLGWIGDAPAQAAAAPRKRSARRVPLSFREDVTEANLPALSALREAHEAKRRAQKAPRKSRRPTRGSAARPPARRGATQGRALDLVRDGESLRARGRTDDAIDAYLTAAEQYEEAGKLDPALALYKLILHLDPTRGDVARAAGARAVDAGRVADGMAIYRRAADALEGEGRIAEALPLVERLLNLNPSDPDLVLRHAGLQAEVEQASAPPQDGWTDQLDAALAEHDARLTPPPVVPLDPRNPSAVAVPSVEAIAPPADTDHQGAGLHDLKAARDAGRAEVEAALDGLESLLAEGTDRPEEEAAVVQAADLPPAADGPDFGREGAPAPEIRDPASSAATDATPWLPPAASTPLVGAPEGETDAAVPKRPLFHEVANLPTLPTPALPLGTPDISPEAVGDAIAEPFEEPTPGPEVIAEARASEPFEEPTAGPEALVAPPEPFEEPTPGPEAIAEAAEPADEGDLEDTTPLDDAGAGARGDSAPIEVSAIGPADAVREPAAPPRPPDRVETDPLAPAPTPESAALDLPVASEELGDDATDGLDAPAVEVEEEDEVVPLGQAIPRAPDLPDEGEDTPSAPPDDPEAKVEAPTPPGAPDLPTPANDATTLPLPARPTPATAARPTSSSGADLPSSEPPVDSTPADAAATGGPDSGSTPPSDASVEVEPPTPASDPARPDGPEISEAAEPEPSPAPPVLTAEAVEADAPEPEAPEPAATSTEEAPQVPLPSEPPVADEPEPTPTATDDAPEAPAAAADDTPGTPATVPAPDHVGFGYELTPVIPPPLPSRSPLVPATLVDPDPDGPFVDPSAIASSDLEFDDPLDDLPDIDIDLDEADDDETSRAAEPEPVSPRTTPPPLPPANAPASANPHARLAHLLEEAGVPGSPTWPPSTLSIEPHDVLEELDDEDLDSQDLPPVSLTPKRRGASAAELMGVDATEVDQPAVRLDDEPPHWGDVGAGHLANPLEVTPPEPPSLEPRPLNPTQGRLTSLGETVGLLARAIEQRATGILHLQESVDLVLVEGVPSARRGKGAVQALIRLLRETGQELGHAGLELLLHVDPERPVAVARELVVRGKMDPVECTIYLNRHLEDGLAALLDHRGGWWFEGGSDVRINRDEVVPDALGLDGVLADLVAARGPWDLVEGGLDPDRRFRGQGDPIGPLTGRDLRFWRLIDGRSSLGDAGLLAGLSPERAAAFAGTQVILQRLVALPVSPRTPLEPSPWMPLLGAHTPGERYVPVSVPPATRRVRPMTATSAPHRALSELDPAGRIRALAELVRTSDYFTILGVDTQASKAAVDRAHQQLRGMLELPERDDPELSRLAREVIRSLDEARDVLKVPELKAAYLNHLRR